MSEQLISAYADFHRRHDETLPAQWALCGDAGNPYSFYALCYSKGDGETAVVTFSLDRAPPWFLDLCLGTLRRKLEAKGWKIVKQTDGHYSWVNPDMEPGEPFYDCPHLAAMALWDDLADDPPFHRSIKLKETIDMASMRTHSQVSPEHRYNWVGDGNGTWEAASAVLHDEGSPLPLRIQLDPQSGMFDVSFEGVSIGTGSSLTEAKALAAAWDRAGDTPERAADADR